MKSRTASMIRQRILELEKKMEMVDGQKARKPRKARKKKVYTLDNLPYTRGFKGKKLLKDGDYGDISVYFGKVFFKEKSNPAADVAYLKALKTKMTERFGAFHYGDTYINRIEVDNSHLRKRRKKDAVLSNAANVSGV